MRSNFEAVLLASSTACFLLLTLSSAYGQYFNNQYPRPGPYTGGPGPRGPPYNGGPGPYQPYSSNYGGQKPSSQGQYGYQQQGPYGSQGPRGPYSSQGSQGTQGSQGSQGSFGSSGLFGSQGNFLQNQKPQPQFTQPQTPIAPGIVPQQANNRNLQPQVQPMVGQTMTGQTMAPAGGTVPALGGTMAATGNMAMTGGTLPRSGAASSAAPVFGRSIVHPRSVSSYGRYFASFSLGGQEISASLASAVMGAVSGSGPAPGSGPQSAGSPAASGGNDGGVPRTSSPMGGSGTNFQGNSRQNPSDQLILTLLTGESPVNRNPADTNNRAGVQSTSPVQEPPTDLSACSPVTNLNIDGSGFMVSHGKQGCKPMTWMEAVDFCQRNNMVITSLGSSVDQLTAKKIMDIPTQFPGMPGFWIGGYVAHPDDKRVANTVTWTAMSRDADLISPGQGIFSKYGESGDPQPDNWEFRNSTDKAPFKKEHCLAVLNNKFNDGLKVHDLACFRKLPVVCKEVNLNPLGKLMDPLALVGLN